MKIRKFNESNSEIIDPNYFNFIFEEFIDKGAIADYDIESGDMYWEIFIEEPVIYDLKKGLLVDQENTWSEIDDYVKDTESLYNFSKTVKSCVDKIKDDFPNIKIKIESEIENSGKNTPRRPLRRLHLMLTL